MKPTPRRRTEPINWQNVRKRLERATAATQEVLRLSPERARAVMEERARLLARVPAQPSLATEVLEVATFALANERYAIETRYVCEVVRFTDFTLVPGAPEFLVGITNLRGEILVVFDLRKFFGIAVRGVTDLARVVVLGGARPEFGVLADAAEEVVRLRTDEVLEPPGSLAGIGREYLRGVTQDALVVLDGKVLLQDTRLVIDESELEARGEQP